MYKEIWNYGRFREDQEVFFENKEDRTCTFVTAECDPTWEAFQDGEWVEIEEEFDFPDNEDFVLYRDIYKDAFPSPELEWWAERTVELDEKSTRVRCRVYIVEFAVYVPDDVTAPDGEYDNTLMDWFSTYRAAETEAQEQANKTGKTVYVSDYSQDCFGDEAEEFIPEI